MVASVKPPLDAESEQRDVTRRYDRMARVYDIYDAPMEAMGTTKRRQRLCESATGSVMEVGIGTGKNLPFYGDDVSITGVDASSGMIARAQVRVESIEAQVQLVAADVQNLPFDDNTFDTVVGTCLFCSVADPVQGLREVGRVVRSNGTIQLLEHVRPTNRVLGWVADVVTMVTRRAFGFRANRRTEENVAAAGLEIVEVTRSGVWREIVARPRTSTGVGDGRGA